MYELGETRKITIHDGGEELVHHLKDPSGPEWLKYQRALAATHDDADPDQATTAAAVKIYDAYVDRVENYALKKVRLMKARPKNFKDFIPEHHKVMVALELINGRTLKKN